MTLLDLIIKKIRKDKTPEVIADELEEDVNTIRHICTIVRDFAPDYNLKQIYSALYEKENYSINSIYYQFITNVP